MKSGDFIEQLTITNCNYESEIVFSSLLISPAYYFHFSTHSRLMVLFGLLHQIELALILLGGDGL